MLLFKCLDTLMSAGEGYCNSFYELNKHDTANSCLKSAIQQPNCNSDNLVISFGKGTRSKRCFCNCLFDCTAHTHHTDGNVVNPSCTLVGSSLGINGFDSYTSIKGISCNTKVR